MLGAGPQVVIAMLAQAGYIGAFVAAGLWMIAAQRRYVRRCAEQVGGVPSEEELASEVVRNPLRSAAVLPQRSWQLWRIVWQPQTDPELEGLRRRVVRRWWLMVAVMVLGFPIVLAALVVGS